MIKKLILSLTLIMIIITLITLSCENNNEIDLYGETFCDTTNVTWESEISDILAKNCVICHGPTQAYNNVRHDSYESELIVVNDGRLRGVVNHLPKYTPMPYDMPMLPECELKKINIWLDNGAPLR